MGVPRNSGERVDRETSLREAEGPAYRIAITGATGFIGSHLARHFIAAGATVAALGRHPPKEPPPGLKFVHHELAGPVSPQTLSGCRTLIHCAHATHSSREPAADGLNVEGSRRLFEAARQAGVASIVYLSSLSAHSEVDSRYARCKLAVENLLQPDRDLILRLGLVLGPGGMAARIRATLAASRIVPLLDGGHQPVHTIDIEDLCRTVATMSRNADSGVFEVGHPDPLTVAVLSRTLARAMRRRALFVPVPLAPVGWLVGAAESLGLNLPVSSENVAGLRDARPLDPASLPNTPEVVVRSFEELVESGVLEERLGSPPKRAAGWAESLKPTDAEILDYARRETDWQQAARFQPLTRGPVVAAAVIAVVGLAGVVVTPIRLLRRLQGATRCV